MCLRCVLGLDGQGALAHRARVLALLALVEHPDAVPTDVALRLGQKVLALVGVEPIGLQCDSAVPTTRSTLEPLTGGSNDS